MKRMILSVVVLFPLFFASCATPQDSAMKEINTSVNEEPVVEEQQNEPRDITIVRQTEDYVWQWVHPTKGLEEFREDAFDCRPTQELLDTYLNDADDKFYLNTMKPTIARNKCLMQSGWTMLRRKKDSTAP